MTNETIDTTRTPAPKERPWESGIRRGRDTIEVAIPDGRDTSTIGNPIHVDANLLYDAIEVLQIAAVTLDPFKDDAPDPAAWYRLRIATRRITTRLEEALLADWPTDYGEPCRAFIAELAGHDEMDDGAERITEAMAAYERDVLIPRVQEAEQARKEAEQARKEA